jgi:hypothetical protein
MHHLENCCKKMHKCWMYLDEVVLNAYTSTEEIPVSELIDVMQFAPSSQLGHCQLLVNVCRLSKVRSSKLSSRQAALST